MLAQRAVGRIGIVVEARRAGAEVEVFGEVAGVGHAASLRSRRRRLNVSESSERPGSRPATLAASTSRENREWRPSTVKSSSSGHASEVWDALADVGALHTRLAPGFVTDCRLEPGARVVTFANGLVARELIVDVDADRRRVAWSVVGGRLSHHNASAQVFDEGGGATRFVWIADFLPDEHAPASPP